MPAAWGADMTESLPKSRRLQYSLRTLLLFVTVAAFGCVLVPPLWDRLSWWLGHWQIKDNLDTAAVAIALLGVVVAAVLARRDHTLRTLTAACGEVMATSKPKRKWFRFGLRPLLVAVAIIAVWL